MISMGSPLVGEPGPGCSHDLPIERIVERLREAPDLLRVDLRDREHDDEEREEQRDEVGVADEPALVVDVLLGASSSGHRFGLLSGPCRSSYLLSSAHVVRRVQTVERRSRTSFGFMPSWMARAPASMISLTATPSRLRSLTARRGEETMLATPTP